MTSSKTMTEIRALDAAHHIHPFTNTRELNVKGARVITGAKGVWLTDGEGNRILDGMAGLWCTAVGYGRDSIVDAVAAQMRELPFYNTFFQSTHPPVAALSERLATLTPAQFQPLLLLLVGVRGDRHRDPARLLLLAACARNPGATSSSRAGGLINGSTVAAASVGGFDAMHRQAGLPVGNIFHAPRPAWWAEGGDLSPEAFGAKVATRHPVLIDGIGVERVAAFIAEPVIGRGRG